MSDPRRPCEDAGQSLVEFALLLVLIGLVAVSVMGAVGADLAEIYDDVSSALTPENGNGHGAGGNGQGNNGGGNGNTGTPPGQN